ncbi:MAG: hypothetical protein ACRDEA_04485 [Microcystaceae cyanobacterium]
MELHHFSVSLPSEVLIATYQAHIAKPFLQQALEVVELLAPESQAVLVDVIQRRLQQQRRDKLVQAVKTAEQEYTEGNICRGTIADLMAELND